ncbi:intercellular adhesion molecule 5 [Cyprinodon tularosa]|uniref:intercellular adhesion molecule 5 n=1 Tax=Cyprinodon tularosa TaxID=77115 RepID=UPI0018E276EF|nr:intercellular adhesion molecule 5 [Cyprinodon tularosa]
MLALLLFCLVPCGADDSCIPGILNTPSVVGYGTDLEANCSTTRDDFDELTLRLGNTSCTNPENNSVVTCAAPVLDFKMKVECRLRLNGTECMNATDLIVYQNPEVRLSVKNGSDEQEDYTLQCDVLSDIPAQNYSVTWFKNNESIETEFIIGEQEKKDSSILAFNISREEKFAQFRCEVQLELEQIETRPVISTTQNVSARYAPELRMNSSETITVPNGGNVTLHCDVEGNPPPEYVWAIDGNPIFQTTKWLEIDQVNSSIIYSCTASNVLGKITVKIHVDVEEVKTEAEKLENCGLTLTPSYLYVKYGNPASIDCYTASTDLAKMAWETAVGKNFGTPPNVTWRVEKLEDFTVKPFCFVTLLDDTQCIKKPEITLYKPPDLVAVSGMVKMKEGEEHTLRCDIFNVAPANKLQVTWYKDGRNVHTANFESLDLVPHTECFKNSAVHPCDVSSNYTFIPNKSDNAAFFTCTAELKFGPEGPLPSVASAPYTAVVEYKPTIKKCMFSGVEDSFRLHDVPCEIDGNPPPAIEWQYNGTRIDEFKLLERTDSGTYKAKVYNSMGEDSTDVVITVEYKPMFSCERNYTVKVNEKANILCEPDGVPSPNLRWFKNGTEIVPHYWKKNESGWYSLRASNKHGEVEHQFYLDILYPPVFTETNATEILVAGKNVSFVCKAEGNPEPLTDWSYPFADNVQKTTKGRQKIITITAATSTNAGSYICVATNEFGSVTRTIQLKDKSTDHFQFWWIILVVLLIFLLIIFLVCFYRRTRIHGEYNFVATNDTNIAMQNRSAVENGVKSANGQS